MAGGLQAIWEALHSQKKTGMGPETGIRSETGMRAKAGMGQRVNIWSDSGSELRIG